MASFFDVSSSGQFYITVIFKIRRLRDNISGYTKHIRP